jgi:hypothetical protein
MQARLNLSTQGWYHLSFSDGMLGRVETQQHRMMVTQQDQRISMLPRLLSDETQPVSWLVLLEEFEMDGVGSVALSAMSSMPGTQS